MSETIVFASAKDGVGKTVLATNMAVILANWGYKTLLIDTNIGSRNSDMRLGIENEIVYDLADIFAGVCRIRQAIIQDKRIGTLYYIPSPQTKGKLQITGEAFKALVENLKEVFDYILIDAPSMNNDNFELSVAAGDKHVIVMIPEFGTIRDIEPLKQKVKYGGRENVYILINKEFPDFTREGLTPGEKDISELLGLPVLGMVPFNKELHRWANQGFPLAGIVGGPGGHDLSLEETDLISGLESVCHKIISEVDNFTADTNI